MKSLDQVFDNDLRHVIFPLFLGDSKRRSFGTPDQALQLLDSIDTGELIGLRDRALIGVMVYSFARVGAVTSMRVENLSLLKITSSLTLHHLTC